MAWRTWMVALLLVVASALVARGDERDLAQAIGLAVQEATNLEEDIGAATFPGSKQARNLRRGKKGLNKALAKHNDGKWKPAASILAKGMGKLLKAFEGEGEGGEPGLVALVGIFEELNQLVVAELPGLGVRVDALPATQGRDRASRLVSDIQGLQFEYRADPGTRRGTAAIVIAYRTLGKAHSKIAKLEKRVKLGLDNLGNDLPKNLPKAKYSIAFSVDGTSAGQIGVTPRLSGAQLRNILKQLIKRSAQAFEQAGCTTSTFGTPFNGTMFTVGVNVTCDDGDGGEETVQLRYTVTKVS